MDTAALPATTMSAEDIGRRVIKLVQNLRTVDDISAANLERQMGIKVVYNDDDPNRYGFGGPIVGDWRYRLFTVPDKKGEPPRRLDFSIRNNDGKADLAPVCTLTFNDYRAALEAAGYSVQRLYGGRNNDPWMFTRGNVVASLYMLHFQDPEKVTACVGTATIRFL